jgi:hypothetical protein
MHRAAFKPRVEKSHRADEWKRCEPYLKWLRGRPCFLSIHAPHRHRCAGKVRACHFDPWGDKGMGTKVSDSASLPMCDGAHLLQTDILGWPEFQRQFGFDGRDVVTAYWLEWLDGTPMGAVWKRKMEEANEL